MKTKLVALAMALSLQATAGFACDSNCEHSRELPQIVAAVAPIWVAGCDGNCDHSRELPQPIAVAAPIWVAGCDSGCEHTRKLPQPIAALPRVRVACEGGCEASPSS